MNTKNSKPGPFLSALPNMLTILRLIMVPILIVLMIKFPSQSQTGMWWSFLVFFLASITDKLDGDIARGYNIITNFGKIADPIADKALVLPAMVLVVWSSWELLPSALVVISLICVVLIIIRELGISIWRMILVRRGRVVPASSGGKIKTVAQMGFIGLSLIPWNTFAGSFVSTVMAYFCWLLLLVATYLALRSGWDYITAK
ncbi:CDP-diacylglycerol--glycerol-3-phosphate 3-phosphatidyltransferase [Boudabousia liubingyangii]|uniref:CDP-diacylglycerol--glycerol-3-phosphate 3-phosphatidyltransferase n=1 Tax=Boudabousia liubingyangii TaxID=1921764 RepID=A0A1Q5PN05_9ACTO|nr:CDP-diacylglycerol--glycerol-3-phosphate 3-phosphatidyltransferase [Boudabousia liubingyangii]OKL47515.1 CDP-diacylglycerol--glycerol-3-phosphate 3-phosphatidyltransferase [Boudabousia liubingyangii]OKL48938.1 CDP-diacylglycerol--glycerol-3-phosphate 3-phosphatidyltransferase [Boudabousia liubingyangii]